MILRSLSNSLRNQDWFTVLIEIVIVFVGVFIGIEVSNWNEARANRNIGHVYTERLIADLENDANKWEHYSAYYQIASDHALAALEGFRHDSAELNEQFLIDLYQASQRWNASTDRGTFDEILSTGRIETFADNETRRTLSNYYGRQGEALTTLNESTDYRRMVRELMDDRVPSEIRARCDDRYVRETQSFVYLQLPEQHFAYEQWKEGILTQTEMDGLYRPGSGLLSKPYLKSAWPEFRKTYHDDFNEWFEECFKTPGLQNHF